MTKREEKKGKDACALPEMGCLATYVGHIPCVSIRLCLGWYPPLPYSDLVGDEKSFLESIHFIARQRQLIFHFSIDPFYGIDNALLHHIVIQRCILIFLSLVLITVSTAVFPVRPSLLAIRFGASF